MVRRPCAMTNGQRGAQRIIHRGEAGLLDTGKTHEEQVQIIIEAPEDGQRLEVK